jgi:hypothetical protein
LDGILLLADDVNIDMLKHNNPDTKVTKRYTEVLDSLNLTQVVIPMQQEQLNLLKPAAVLPCPLVSDHDAHTLPLTQGFHIINQCISLSETRNGSTRLPL